MAHPTGANRATVDDDESTTTLPTTLAAEFRAAGIRDFSIEGTDKDHLPAPSFLVPSRSLTHTNITDKSPRP